MIVLHLALVHRHIALRWMAIAVVTGVLFLPPALDQIDDLQTMVERHTVARNNAMQPMYRDIARVIRRDQHTGGIVVLADPNASLAISYYGLFKTIGTFYWENTQGLKTTAAIFSPA